MRAAESERHAEALRVADDDVGAELAGRRQQRQREQVGGGRDQHLRGVGAGDDRSDVDDGAVIVGVLQQRAEHLGRVDDPCVRSADLEPDPERFGAALQHGHGLRKDPVRDQEDAAVGRLLRRHPMQQRHRLAGRGRLVEQRRPGHRQAGEIGDDGLEVEQRFETALGDLGLVGRVRGVPARVLEHAAANHTGRDRVVVAETDEAPQHGVGLGHGGEPGHVLVLRLAVGQRHWCRPADGGGNGFVDQRVERRRANRRQHLGQFVRAWTYVTADEWFHRTGAVSARGLRRRRRRAGCRPRPGRRAAA